MSKSQTEKSMRMRKMASLSWKLSALAGVVVVACGFSVNPLVVLADSSVTSTISTSSTSNSDSSNPPITVDPNTTIVVKVDSAYRTCADPNSVSGEAYQNTISGEGIGYGFNTSTYLTVTVHNAPGYFDYEAPDVITQEGNYYNIPDSSAPTLNWSTDYGLNQISKGTVKLNSLNCTDLPTVVGSASIPNNDGKGYWLATSIGQVHYFGDALFYGSPASSHLTLPKPIAGMAATPDGKGYYLFDQDGKVYVYGDAQLHVNYKLPTGTNDVIGLTATPDGKGYWLYSSDGDVWPEGDAVSYGNGTAEPTSYRPFVGMATIPDGKGYYLTTATGHIWQYGAAVGYGTPYSEKESLPMPLTGMATSPTGDGYWAVASNGWIYPFGDAGKIPEFPDLRPQSQQPVNVFNLKSSIIGMVTTDDNTGYWMIAKDGGVFIFGDANYYGSAQVQ